MGGPRKGTVSSWTRTSQSDLLYSSLLHVYQSDVKVKTNTRYTEKKGRNKQILKQVLHFLNFFFFCCDEKWNCWSIFSAAACVTTHNPWCLFNLGYRAEACGHKSGSACALATWSYSWLQQHPEGGEGKQMGGRCLSFLDMTFTIHPIPQRTEELRSSSSPMTGFSYPSQDTNFYDGHLLPFSLGTAGAVWLLL